MLVLRVYVVLMCIGHYTGISGQTLTDSPCSVCSATETYGFGLENQFCRCTDDTSVVCTCGPCFGPSTASIRRFGKVNGVCEIGIDCDACHKDGASNGKQPSNDSGIPQLTPQPLEPSTKNETDADLVNSQDEQTKSSSGLAAWQIIILVLIVLFAMIPFVCCLKIRQKLSSTSSPYVEDPTDFQNCHTGSSYAYTHSEMKKDLAFRLSKEHVNQISGETPDAHDAGLSTPTSTINISLHQENPGDPMEDTDDVREEWEVLSPAEEIPRWDSDHTIESPESYTIDSPDQRDDRTSIDL